jgi:hypothetical protein
MCECRRVKPAGDICADRAVVIPGHFCAQVGYSRLGCVAREPGIYIHRLGLWIVSLVCLAYEVCEAGVAGFMGGPRDRRNLAPRLV